MRARVRRHRIIQPTGGTNRYVALTKGQTTVVTKRCYDWAMQWNWCAIQNKYGKFYASRSQCIGGKNQTIFLHRALYEEFVGPIPPDMEIDHKNRDSIDNRLRNLRVASHRENMHNRSLHSTNRTGVRGVYWDKTHRHYGVMVTIDGRRVRYARCKTLAEAKKKRKEAELLAYKDFRPR